MTDTGMMWPRDLELSLGFWLLLSPFIFGHDDGAQGLWATDLVCGSLVLALALLAYRPRLRYIHLAELLPALWLIVCGWLGSQGGFAPGYQNEIVVGLLVAMIAIVPSKTDQPPEGWRRRADAA